MLKWTF
ncbi:hypothetical protein BOH78_5002 [Pichia kudriavzevii]|nr:hypothetical protein BOH78_5448 [Pichia kudriavzevii]ONH70246.1 hypothetical protein BOH78_5389 [Pichia kudriavzevii]ONH70273.1 hypothetical protein BOH78_5359 [Pichia kudriavzevii]ONH70329.1 hypothetical protein BOH78_5300 [Pichia kudriavzevii]ONH70508.1 hypothetical protein BOH78_5174 [Pichia kudriavzevii]